MAARKAPAQKRPVDLSERLPALREALGRDRALNPAALVRLRVPKPQHPAAIELLLGEGFEKTKSGVRVPLKTQLRALIAERSQVPVRQLARLLGGASQKEAGAAAATLAKEGHAQLILRGKIEIVATTAADGLSRDQLSALARACKALASQSGRALKRAPMTLLRDDLREQLLDLLTPSRTTAPSLSERLTAELPRHVHDTVGLVFIPEAVRALTDQGIAVADVQTALLDAHRARQIELRPESGLDRLSREQLELCPPGPQGTRLSWARLLEARP